MAAITDLTTLAAADVVDADWMVIHDLSAGTDKKIARSSVVATTGTWTPTIEGTAGNPTVTYADRLGYYTRIGDICIAVVRISTTACSGGSGSLRIAGLPFTAANGYGGGSCSGKFTLGGSATYAVLQTIAGSTNFYVVGNTSGADVSLVSVTGWAATSYLAGTLIYKVT